MPKIASGSSTDLPVDCPFEFNTSTLIMALLF
jgi:hypothetical protein